MPSPRAASTSRTSSPTRTRPRPRSATRTRRSTRRWRCCPARCARPTRRSSTCARRSTTSTCSWPRPSRRRRTSRRFLSQLRPLVQEARPTISDLNTLVHRSGPNNDLTDLLGKAPALARGRQAVLRELDRGAAAGHAGHQVHPALHAGLRRLAARLRRRAARTTTPTATSRASADLQRLLVQPEHESADADSRPASAWPGCRPARSGAAPARRRRRRWTARRPTATPTAPWTATPASCPPAHEAPPRHRQRARRGRGAAGLRHRRERRQRRLPRARDLHERRSRSSRART